nr:AraC family transcriptional regulator [Allopusillimonas soli]
MPVADRLPVWREVFGQKVVYLDIEPAKSVPFHADGTLCALPGAAFSSVSATPIRVSRTQNLIAKDKADTLIVVIADTPLKAIQGGKEKVVDAGDAIFVRGGECSTLATERETRVTSIAVPIDSLVPLMPRVEDLSMTVISRQCDALGLFLGYVDLLRDWRETVSTEFGHMAANHLQDLVAALGRAGEPRIAPLEDRPGVRAARLRGLKAAIEKALCEPNLSLHDIAAGSGISPRYVRKLFQDEQTTFSGFVLGRRLDRARRLLGQPEHAASTIAAIAYACGFGDLSYFNRAFRRCYGMTPSEHREDAWRNRWR